jgi:adenosylcobinamide kinase/adenosylcobinamide-phosphate guanylyltransferase
LIDCGPEIPAAAGRHGADLSLVRTLLFTHAHPDHVGPAALLFRHWARRDERLDVFGPSAALDQLEHWLASDDPVHLHPVRAGDVFEADGFEITALAAAHGDETIGEALLYSVRDHDGQGLFYATDTGPLPDATLTAVRDAQFDLVLLEETFGDHLSHDNDHLDLRTVPDQLRRLRSLGAISDSTDVVAVHLSHHNPPPAVLERRLAEWSARVVPDGTVITVGRDASGRAVVDAPRPRRTLVLGGARSGKSRHAESLLAASTHVTYVATGPDLPGDDEWLARVAAHRERRPDHWTTIETHDVADVLGNASRGDCLLIDCVTLWLTRVMDEAGAWHGDLTDVDKQIERLLEAWTSTSARVVAVSNEVGQGIVPDTASGRVFRDTQGRLNAAIAAASDDVTLMVAGRPLPL